MLKFNFGSPTKARGDENMRRDERLGSLYLHLKIFAHDQIHKITIAMVDLRPGLKAINSSIKYLEKHPNVVVGTLYP